MRRTVARTLAEIAGKDERIVLLTADLGFMVLEEFSDIHPSRFFNVGVAEANMVGLATGLASCGFIPFVYSISTFASMRCYEQIRNGPILHELPVRIIGVGGGFEYGHAGPTHHGLEDLGIMRIQPGLSVVVPADYSQASKAIKTTYDLAGPIYYRIGKREDYRLPGLEGRFDLGKCNVLLNGRDVLVVTMGSISSEVMEASNLLAEKGINITVCLVSSLNPSPVDELVGLFSPNKVVITVEEHFINGGLGSLVAEIIAETGSGCRLVRCGVQGFTQEGGGESFLRNVHGLSPYKIAQTVEKAVLEVQR
jgi:transketolase